LTSGDYTFSLSSDEGSRLHMNTALLIDNVGDKSCLKPMEKVKEMPVGQQFIRVEYFHNYGTSCSSLSYKGADTNNKMMVVPDYALKAPAERMWVGPVVPQGWSEEIFYFRKECTNPKVLDDMFYESGLRMPAVVRQVRLINYPYPYVPGKIWSGFTRSTDFAARWTTRLLFRNPGTYQFKLMSAGEAKMLMDHGVIIASQGTHPRRATKGQKTISKKSVRHGIRIEYFNAAEQPSCTLTYKGPDTGKKWSLVSMAIGGHAATMSIRLKNLDYDKLIAKKKRQCRIFWQGAAPRPKE